MTRTTKGAIFVSLLLAWALACVGEAPHFGDTSPGDDGGPGDDAGRTCDPRGKFTKRKVDGLVNTAGSEQMPFVTDDELTMYFDTTPPPGDAGPGNLDLVVSRRKSLGDPWGKPEPLANVNGPSSDQAPWVSSDGKKLLFSSNRLDAPCFHIFQATRNGPTGPFGPAIEAPGINPDGTNESQQSIHEGLGELWFLSGPSCRSDTLFALQHAPVLGDGGYGAAKPVTSIDSTTATWSNWMPRLSHDGLALYFSSNRSSPDAQGNFDIWRAIRTDIHQDFPASSVENVKELNSSQADTMGSLSLDGCRLYFWSRDPDGNDDIYVAERQPTKD